MCGRRNTLRPVTLNSGCNRFGSASHASLRSFLPIRSRITPFISNTSKYLRGLRRAADADDDDMKLFTMNSLIALQFLRRQLLKNNWQRGLAPSRQNDQALLLLQRHERRYIIAQVFIYKSGVGKTTTLLQSSFNYLERGMRTIIFTPELDTRSPQGVVASRIGLSQEAVPFNNTDFDFLEYCRKIGGKLDCVLVDEAQFLTKLQVMQLTDIVDVLRVPVLCYGLRTDFRGDPFEGSAHLLAVADTLQEIKTICHCGRKATFNARITQSLDDGTLQMVTEGDQVMCGGEAQY